MRFLCIFLNVRQLLKQEIIINQELHLRKKKCNLWQLERNRGLPAIAAFSQQFESAEGQASQCQTLSLKHSLPASSLPPANNRGEEWESDGLVGGQMSFGRGCMHAVWSRGDSLLLVWGWVPAPHAGTHGRARPELFFLPITQLYLFFPHCVFWYGHPPFSSSKTRMGQEELGYHTHKSSIYCLNCADARSRYRSGVILNVLQIQNEEVAVHWYLLPTSLAHHDAGTGKAGWESPATEFWAAFCSFPKCVCNGGSCALCAVVLWPGLTLPAQSCQAAATNSITLFCH